MDVSSCIRDSDRVVGEGGGNVVGVGSKGWDEAMCGPGELLMIKAEDDVITEWREVERCTV